MLFSILFVEDGGECKHGETGVEAPYTPVCAPAK
jgi:hypothetical protein